MQTKREQLAVVGPRGAVGREQLLILEERGWPGERLVLIGRGDAVGMTVAYGGGRLRIREEDEVDWDEMGYAILCAGNEAARVMVPGLVQAGVMVVDHSSAYRMDAGVGLVIPEVNGAVLDEMVQAGGVVANPNCSITMLVMAVEPLREAFGLEGIVVSTYQAVSGAGQAAVEELHEQSKGMLEGRPVEARVFPVACGFNVFPHESAVDPATGMNEEEGKMVAEARKIWQMPELRVLPTCVRVPVERVHSQSILLELRESVTVEHVWKVLDRPGLVVDRNLSGLGVTPMTAVGRDEVFVGRVRVDESGRRVQLWVCCDQLRKGAALNAMQIVERVMAGRSERTRAAGAVSSSG